MYPDSHIAFGALRPLLCLCLSALLASAQGPASPRLAIEVLEGQGAIHNVARGAAIEPAVEVRDANGRPVAGASVTFTLPAVGPGGSFADGSQSVMTTSDQAGRAVARGFRPNRILGQFEIRVSASQAGRTGSATIAQTNAAPVETEKRSARKWAIVLGLVGGAVAAGAFAAAGGGKSSTPGANSPADVPVGTITPGTPGFGPPR